jgi:DnaK suppressor protein
MTKNELNRFRETLLASVAELECLARKRDGITIERSADLLEEIQAASERALAVSNLDRGFNQLRSARAALRRIQEGSFGTCVHCDEDIHPKRLAAVPWAPFCIRCQDVADRNPEELQTPTNDLRESRMKIAVYDDTPIYSRKAA